MKTLQALFVFTLAGNAVAQSLETPPIVIRSNTQTGTLWAQDRVGAPASDGTVQLQTLSGGASSQADVNATGANLGLNSNSVTQPSAVVTAGDPPCASQARSWTVGSSTCTGTLPGSISGLNAAVSDSVQPVTGGATFTCSMGNWSASPLPGATCITSTCAAGPLYWNGSATCGANFPTLNSGQTSAVLASVNGNSGSASFTCNAGAWQLAANYGCSAPAPKNCVWPTDAGWLNNNSRGYITTKAGGTNTNLSPRTSPTSYGYLGTAPAVTPHGGSVWITNKTEQVVYTVAALFTCSNGTFTKAPGMYYLNGESLGEQAKHTASETQHGMQIFYAAESGSCMNYMANYYPYVCARRSFYSPQ